MGNTIQHNNTIQFGKTYYCIVLFSEQFKKIEKKPITQYNFVTFKVFMQLQYVGFGTIKKKQKKCNNTIQHNNTIQFCRNLRFLCRNCILLLNCIVMCCFLE